MLYLSAFLLALFATIALMPLARRVALAFGAVDHPGPRKVHTRPVPRAGGLAMVLGAFVPIVLWAPPSRLVWALGIGAGILVVAGFADDRKDLDYRAKFAAQTAAALVLYFSGVAQIRSLGGFLPYGVVLPGWVAFPLTLVAVLGVTNAINLSDGLDGLAGGISGLVFGCIGLLAYQAGEAPVALACAAIGGAILGFLRFNTYPATLFMGDAGSQFLGFAAITLALHLTQKNDPLSPFLPLLILGIPVLDTLAVMTERVARGRSPFEADKNHIHHKLIRLGLYAPDAVRLIYVAQGALVTLAYYLRYDADWLVLLAFAAFAAPVVAGFAAAERIGWRLAEYGPQVTAVKAWAARIWGRGGSIKVAFPILKVGLPSLLFASCLWPAEVPLPLGALGAAAATVGGVAMATRRSWAGLALRLGVYSTVPFVVYLGQTGPPPWLGDVVNQRFNLLFGALALVSVWVVKSSQRKAFWSTPLDVLMLLGALVLVLTGGLPRSAALTAAKMIVLFFGYEVVVAELRGRLGFVGFGTVASLAFLAVRSLTA